MKEGKGGGRKAKGMRTREREGRQGGKERWMDGGRKRRQKRDKGETDVRKATGKKIGGKKKKSDGERKRRKRLKGGRWREER